MASSIPTSKNPKRKMAKVDILEDGSGLPDTGLKQQDFTTPAVLYKFDFSRAPDGACPACLCAVLPPPCCRLQAD